MSTSESGSREEAINRILFENRIRSEIEQRGWTIVNIETDFFDWVKGQRKGLPRFLTDRKSIILRVSGDTLFYDEQRVAVKRNLIDQAIRQKLEKEGWSLVGEIIGNIEGEGVYIKSRK